jgi:subtilisin family serine protease
MKSAPMFGRIRLTAMLAAALAAILIPSGATAAQQKIKVEKLDDLPRHTYTVKGPASELFLSRPDVLILAGQVKQNTLEMIEKYDIQDRNTLQSLYSTLQAIAFLEGDEARVFEYLDKIRGIEEKEAARLTQGLIARPFFAARHETNQPPESAEFRASFKKHYAAEVQALPWAVVQDNLEKMKGNAEMLSEAVITGMIQGTIDPPVAKSGYLSGDQARQLLTLRLAMETFLPVKAEVAAVLTDLVAANRVEKPDIWPERNVVIEPKSGAEKVRVAVWDTGVDVSVFQGRLWTNAREEMNGKDDDGNGFVDDRNGIAHDAKHDRTPALLYPLGDAESDRDQLEGLFKGLFDLQAALSTPEAAAFRKTMAAMKPEEVTTFLEEVGLYTHHAHGTHVAGIAIEGNPQAEIVVARLGTDHHLIPPPPTMEETKKLAREFQETVDYFTATGVRVANMSWVLSAQEFENDLEKNAIGSNQEERARMAREMFAVAKDGLRKAFESAPGILFIGGAGNSDNDVNFDEFIPPSFDLPNLMIAGAVDQAGEATDFTSFGQGVDVYSNGFEVDSFVPGGHRMRLSGTSMASPNVVNLAAKLFALDPSLTPVEVADLIKRGAEPRGKNGALLVINPRRSVELLREMQGTRG